MEAKFWKITKDHRTLTWIVWKDHKNTAPKITVELNDRFENFHINIDCLHLFHY